MSQTRKSGYYRVKSNGEWKIAKYDSDLDIWWWPVRAYAVLSSSFDAIDENPINPEP